MRGTKGLLVGVGLLLVLAVVAGEARAQAPLPVPGPGGLVHTNGNKVVVSGTTLHMVYRDATKGVQYTFSVAGGPWSTPFTVSAPQLAAKAMHPTIAVFNSIVGVAWILQTAATTLPSSRDCTGPAPPAGDVPHCDIGTLYYRVMNVTWMPPVQISCTGCAHKPSMVNLGPDIHIAWAGDFSTVLYAKFNIVRTPTSTPPILVEQVPPSLSLCCGLRFYDVSVAVAPRCNFVAPERVQVAATFVDDDRLAFGYPLFPPFPNYDLVVGVKVFRRVGAGVWSMVYQFPRGGGPFDGGSGHTAYAISVSMSAARSTNTSGDFILGWSDIFNHPLDPVPERTKLVRMNGATGVWTPALSLSTERANIDVINRWTPQGVACASSTPPPTCENFHVAWSEVNASGYGPVYFCSGLWTGAATAPTFFANPAAGATCGALDSVVAPTATAPGRDPQVLYYQASGTETRAMFDHMINALSFELEPYQVPAGTTFNPAGGLCDGIFPHPPPSRFD